MLKIKKFAVLIEADVLYQKFWCKQKKNNNGGGGGGGGEDE